MHRVRPLVVFPTPPFRIFPWASKRIVCASTLYAKSHLAWWCTPTQPKRMRASLIQCWTGRNYGTKTLDHNERIHYGDLKDRYRQRRDRTRKRVAQLATLNTRNKQKSAFWPKRCPRRISRSIASLKRSLLFATSRTCWMRRIVVMMSR
jgi:hypothetical protein